MAVEKSPSRALGLAILDLGAAEKFIFLYQDKIVRFCVSENAARIRLSSLDSTGTIVTSPIQLTA